MVFITCCGDPKPLLPGPPGVDVTLHVIPKGQVTVPWLRPTGTKALLLPLFVFFFTLVTGPEV